MRQDSSGWEGKRTLVITKCLRKVSRLGRPRKANARQSGLENGPKRLRQNDGAKSISPVNYWKRHHKETADHMHNLMANRFTRLWGPLSGLYETNTLKQWRVYGKQDTPLSRHPQAAPRFSVNVLCVLRKSDFVVSITCSCRNEHAILCTRKRRRRSFDGGGERRPLGDTNWQSISSRRSSTITMQPLIVGKAVNLWHYWRLSMAVSEHEGLSSADHLWREFEQRERGATHL